MVKKLLITDDAKTFYIKDIDKDYHTQHGFIKSEDLKKAKPGSKVITNKDKEFVVIDPSFIDLYSKMKRGPQIIPRKDIGIIITETGIGKNSKVIDSGSGSGANCCALANIAKEVISYELREDFHEIVKKNKEFMDLKNLKLKNKDIYEGITEKNVDVLILDLPEPWRVIEHAKKALKPGGFLVSYSPCVPQMMDFVDGVEKDSNFIHQKSLEIIQRDWDVKGRKVRPQTNMMGHSGFISFARKI